MSTTAVRSNEATSNGHAGQVDLKLEVITVPVSDFDRAKEFYQNLGWRLDIDFINGAGRAIQFTPPGSQCSIHLGKKVTQPAQDISSIFDLRDPELVVSDIEAARDDLKRRGVEVSEVFHFGGSAGPFGGLAGGIAPGHQSYGSYATFKDPDGNGWLLQEVTTRFPGRVAGDTMYTSVGDLAQALRRAEAAHGEHEKRTGERDADWPSWYATYMIAEQSGEELPL